MRKSIAIALLALATLEGRARAINIVPYELAVDSQIANRIDVYNPASSTTGLTTPVEMIDVVFNDAQDANGNMLAHLAVDSPNGSTPGNSVFIDAFFDGTQLAGNAVVFHSTLYFTTPSDPSGHLVIVGAPDADQSFPTPLPISLGVDSPTPISYALLGTAGAGWPTGHFGIPNGGNGGNRLVLYIPYQGGALVDPTQPLFRFEVSATGPVPEPSSIVLAALALAGLAAWRWRRSARH
jgi:MYXO-CTERM domain-containing protein